MPSPAMSSPDIAIIGMAGRFPGAEDMDQFWDNVARGVESITVLDDATLAARGVGPEALRDPHYVKAAALFPDVSGFDAGFFGFSPRDAAIMDPQHRHFLECAWEAFESAGYVPSSVPGAVGVFAGSGHNAYLPYNLLTNPRLVEEIGFFLVRHTSNDKDFLATRVSYCFDLKGTSLNIQTACSTSLVAVHLACQHLLSGELDMALAGGVTIELPHGLGYHYKEGEILSPDGHCRSFDARSQGTVFGSGAALVVLKRLEDAQRDRDTVLAVIRGSAVNNDGAGKVGYLAPGLDGQAACVAEAIGMADVDPRSIGLVEAHGTGTPVGDPIEVQALTQTYRKHTQDVGFAVLGSVKSNIGHLDTAAGTAGLIKAVQALRHQTLPPTVHFHAPNPACQLETSPFRVIARAEPWPNGKTPRRAAVSALGVGGTNAHVVLEEAPLRSAPSARSTHQLLISSARSPAALETLSRRLSAQLSRASELDLGEVAHTLQVGRKTHLHRQAVVVSSLQDAASVLASRDPSRVRVGHASADEPAELVFLFAGGGAQYPGMGAALYRDQPVYAEALDECLRAAKKNDGLELSPYLVDDTQSEAHAKALEQPSLALPALFSVQYALARLLESLGLHPTAMIGHSMGEYTAACLAGVFSLEDALRLVRKRGQLFETLPEGTMLSVPLGADELQKRLSPELSIAARNGESLSVASGPVAAIEALAAALEKDEIQARRVRISVAAHSAMLEPILDEFRGFVRTIRYGAPKRPFVSNLSGEFIRPEEATDPEYWVRHLRHTVDFAGGLSRVMDGHRRVLLEVGPGNTLATLARTHPAARAQRAILSTLPHPSEAVSALELFLDTLGRSFVAGAELDFSALHRGKGRGRVPLPTYPFEHQRFWIEPGEVHTQGSGHSLKRRAQLEDWFHQPVYHRRPALAAAAEGGKLGTWVVLGPTHPLSQGLVRAIEARGGRAELVTDAPTADELYERLGAASSLEGVVDLRAAATPNPSAPELFRGSFRLAQALLRLDGAPPKVALVSSGLFGLENERVDAEQAVLLGVARVLPRELVGLSLRLVDLDPRAQAETSADALAAELCSGETESPIIRRGRARYTRVFEACGSGSGPLPLKQGGVYLITGGLGGLGLHLAEHLATRYRAKLALLARHAPPPKSEWMSHLAEHEKNDPTSQRIRSVAKLEAAGAEVLVLSADVTDQAQVERAVREARGALGPISGVIHAAGTLDDGLIGLKTEEAALSVLAPKVLGAQVLDRAFADTRLDFMALFSSVSSVIGVAGQVDYAAANAFLDSFAEARSQRRQQPTVSIGWGPWRQVGMAAAIARSLHLEEEPLSGEAFEHPWLGAHEILPSGEELWAGRLSARTHWVLDEHRVQGAAVMPGTGYLELLCAAARTEAGFRTLSNLSFAAPLAVPESETRRVDLRRVGDELIIESDQVHVRAHLGPLVSAEAPRLDLEALRALCPQTEAFVPSAALQFGPRWSSVESLALGDKQALLELKLPETYAGDVEQFVLHPALLDLATAGAQRLVSGLDPARDLYVPLAYDEVRVYAPLPARSFSHVRLVEASAELLRFDVTLADPTGGVLAELTGFTMKRLAENVALALPARARSEVFEVGFREGLLPSEGAAAFERALGLAELGHVVVSPQDLSALADAYKTEPEAQSAEASSALSLDLERPNLATPFVAPRSPREEDLAGIWRSMLGINEVGVFDDFFELGGHSLLLTQLASRVRKKLSLNVPLATLFERRTIASIAELLDSETTQRHSQIPKAKTNGAGPRVTRPSFAQERLWFLDQLEPGRATYNIPSALALEGPLEVAALQAALAQVVDRHEALRTRFVAHEGGVQAVVDPPQGLLVPLEPFSGSDSLERRLEEEARRPFDLAAGPLIRASILERSPTSHVLLLSVHHIVADGYSMARLYSEVSELYRAKVEGRAPQLPSLPIQYADYAEWQRTEMQGPSLERQLDHWREALSGELGVLELPADRPRPAVRSERGLQRRKTFGRETVAKLELLAKTEGASLFSVLLAAFDVLMYRHTGQTDVLVGSPIAQRDREEIAEGIGFYTNTVVFRGRLEGNPSFRELLGRIKAQVMGGLAHQEAPYDQVVNAVTSGRGAGAGLFSVMFSFQQAPDDALSLPGVTVSVLPTHSGTAKFDLLLELQQNQDGILGLLELSEDLFGPETAERLLLRFDQLLEAVAANPDQPISKLRVLPEAEEARLVHTFNQTTVSVPEPALIPALFERWVQETPEAIAVRAGDVTLSYAGLDARAEEITQALLARGVGPGALVGLYVERSCDMLAALLGILRAGAAYVPMDPLFPAERLQYMLEDAKVKLVLTERALVSEGPTGDHQRLLLEELAKVETPRPRPEVSPESLAYVIYTSGSTGKPKGVALEHRGVVNFLLSMQKDPGLSSEDRLLAVTTLSFDIAVLELFGPICSGGTTLIASKEIATDGHRLKEALKDWGATVMQATPASWRMLLEADWKNEEGVRVFCGGEAFPRELADRLLALGAPVYNLYGPTETTIWSTVARVVPGEGPVSIGRPIDNTTVFILDAERQPVPIGVAGELWIGGMGLARGYLGRDELTNERFQAFRDGQRIYQTGDLARWRPDGTLECLGRTDFQVKVRGFRIELGEIEAVLAKHPAVATSVVVVRSFGGDERLVAYVKWAGREEPTPSELRRFMRGELPDYMLPSTFVAVEVFPLTPNGKIDRRALPDPEGLRSEVDAEHVPPETTTEKLIAQVWQELLGMDRVGAFDNFFALGGHSLLSMRAIHKIEQAAGHRLNPRDLIFQNLSQLAALVDAHQPRPASAELSSSFSMPPPPRPRPPEPAPKGGLRKKLIGAIKARVLPGNR